jgi:3-dehydroquinate dehydratase-1
MSLPDRQPFVRFGSRRIGQPASVAGVVTTVDMLERAAANPAALPCDLLELRLGEVPADAPWEHACRRLNAAGLPVLATLRNRAEGGTWDDADPARLDAFARALRVCSAVDVEWHSTLRPRVSALAAAAGLPVVYSCHDFTRTPPADTLLSLARTIAAEPGAVVKMALKVNEPADLAALRAVLAADLPAPRCIIGMGPLGAATRVDFARAGSCLTYGWLDHPTAPGQPSCADLRAALASAPGHRS